MFSSRFALLLPLALLTTAPAIAQAPPAQHGTAPQAEALHMIIDDYWAYQLEQYPEFASSLGVDDPVGRVSDASLEAEDKRVEKAKAWLKRLDAIDTAALSEDDKTNYGILRRTLVEEIEANSYGQRTINFTNRGGWHQNFASMQNNLPFRTAQDYRTYINRLKQYATINDQSIAVANQALAGGYVQPCVSMEGYETSISGLLTDDPKDSRFYQPTRRPRRSKP